MHMKRDSFSTWYLEVVKAISAVSWGICIKYTFVLENFDSFIHITHINFFLVLSFISHRQFRGMWKSTIRFHVTNKLNNNIEIFVSSYKIDWKWVWCINIIVHHSYWNFEVMLRISRLKSAFFLSVKSNFGPKCVHRNLSGAWKLLCMW